MGRDAACPGKCSATCAIHGYVWRAARAAWVLSAVPGRLLVAATTGGLVSDEAASGNLPSGDGAGHDEQCWRDRSNGRE